MPRDLYPFKPERTVIRQFLAGEKVERGALSEDTSLRISKGVLSGGEGTRLLWYDSADALTTVVNGPVTKHIANYVLEQMGMEERITVEVKEPEEPLPTKGASSVRRVRYFFGGVPADEAPFVLVGPMTLMAWRAENGFSLDARSKLRRKL